MLQVANGEVAEGELMSLSAYHSMLFNLKVNSGIYARDFVKCFCGSNNYREITNKDRYGIDYSLCLCYDCGLLYSNPRMTEEAFELFYKNDYRNIYSDRCEAGEYADTVQGKNRIKDFVYNVLREFEMPMPKTVFEIGCGNGSNLAVFKDCETVVGIDYDEQAIEIGKRNGMDLRIGGLEVLESLDKKADLIIIHHVLEHMTDIEKDLKRIRELLDENGFLYISVPGFYTYDKSSLFQNAHNYQFTGNTLGYVMRVCGFSDFYLDEQIESLWHKADFMSKDDKFAEEYRTIQSFLLEDKFLMPNVRVNCKFTLTERRNNIKNTISTGVPEITELVNKHIDSDAIIICGGSTIEEYPEKIKSLQKGGAKVYTIERMYKWCLINNIIPDYVVALDSSDDVVESFNVLNINTVHLIVAQVPPIIFEKLNGYKTYYFLLMQKGIDYSKMYDSKKTHRLTFINSGSSVSLCCMSIAMTLGARNLHIFGFDCHVDKKNYADGITGVGCISDTMEIEIDGRIFKTTASYFAFMQQFFELYLTAKTKNLLHDVKIYGDSMVKVASKIETMDGDKNA